MLAPELTHGKTPTSQIPALRPQAAPPATPAPRWRWLILAALAVGLLAAAAGRRIGEKAEAGSETTHENAPPSVNVVRPEAAAAGAVTLPATLQPDQTTDLHPRVDGFIKAWHADIGARVRAGQLLAEIDAPELDQEALRAEATARQGEADLQQAKAELEEARSEVALAASNITRARANLDFASAQVQRYRRLLAVRSVSNEEYDRTVSEFGVKGAEVKASEADHQKRESALVTRAASIRVKEATLANARANVRRLHELQGFKRIVAPFAGVVSRRTAENGMLVSPTAVKALFRVVNPDLLRARLAVPQAYAADVRPGDNASVSIPEQPGKAFTARVTRTAGEIEEASRTVAVELEIPNSDGRLLAGTYAQVTVTGRASAGGALLIPASAVMMRPEGPTAAVVKGGEARIRRIELGRDRGGKVEVLTGLSAHDSVISNPPDGLADGSRVAASEVALAGR